MRYRKLKSFLAAALCVAVAPTPCLAGSPEFAYPAEKWAALRDDKLEYDEIADLIHEYNNTVIQNQIDYREYKDESRDDISDDYYEAADDVYGRLSYPDSGDENYASGLSSYLNGQIQADKLREQGDDNVEDGEIKKMEYDQAEAQLVKQAQELMISYWSQHWSVKSLQKTKEQAQSSYDSSIARLSAGMAVQSDVLLAQEAVASAQASILSAESDLSKTKESLCLMLGWTYGAQVEIGEAPTPDLDSVNSIDIDADVQAGLEANYALKIQKKKVDNAQSSDNREKLEEEYKNQKETAAAGIKNAYRNLILSKSDYDQALQAYTLEQGNMDTAERKMAAGTITRNDYTKQQSALTTAQVSVQTRQLELLKAQLEYRWAVDGLASVS